MKSPGAIDESVRAATRKAIRETEEERTQRAYREQPDSDIADDWSNAEEWRREAIRRGGHSARAAR